MLEQIQQLWPVLSGNDGWVAALAAWRGLIAVAVPMFNMKLQAWFTKLFVESPRVANSIVVSKIYKAFALIFVMTVGIRLPSEASMLVHQVKENIKNDSNPIAFKRSVSETANSTDKPKDQ